MIHVFVVVTAKRGMRQAVLDVLHPIVPTIHAEEGCIEYTVTTDAPSAGNMHSQTWLGEDSFAMIQKWASTEALQAHASAPFVAEYFEKVAAIMAGEVVYYLKDE